MQHDIAAARNDIRRLFAKRAAQRVYRTIDRKATGL